MNATMNLHNVATVKARIAESEGTRWVTLSHDDAEGKSILELTVFSDEPQALLDSLCGKPAALNAAYADGRADEREEWADLLAAAKCAENVLFLFSAELEAMGNKAPNVRQMLSTAIARVESSEGEAADQRRTERAMEGFLS